MKITDVNPFITWGGLAGRNWLFVNVQTDEGIHRWGGSSLDNQTPTIARAVDMLAAQVLGQDTSAIERHWQTMFLHNRYRSGVVINSALSAIEQVQIEPVKMHDGHYALPTAPGLGVDLNEDVIAANPYRNRPVIRAYHADGCPPHP